MLSHGILQAPHGLNVGLVHKLPHLQHLSGSGGKREGFSCDEQNNKKKNGKKDG